MGLRGSRRHSRGRSRRRRRHHRYARIDLLHDERLTCVLVHSLDQHHRAAGPAGGRAPWRAAEAWRQPSLMRPERCVKRARGRQPLISRRGGPVRALPLSSSFIVRRSYVVSRPDRLVRRTTHCNSAASTSAGQKGLMRLFKLLLLTKSVLLSVRPAGGRS